MNPARTPLPAPRRAPAYDGSAEATGAGWTRIAPQSGVAVELAPGDRLTVLDPCGEQVSDLYLVAADDAGRGLLVGSHDRLRQLGLRLDRVAPLVATAAG